MLQTWFKKSSEKLNQQGIYGIEIWDVFTYPCHNTLLIQEIYGFDYICPFKVDIYTALICRQQTPQKDVTKYIWTLKSKVQRQCGVYSNIIETQVCNLVLKSSKYIKGRNMNFAYQSQMIFISYGYIPVKKKTHMK